MNTIFTTIGVSFATAFLLGVLLGLFKKIFAVPVNQKEIDVREQLPGANCGGCGFAGCDGYAKAVAEGTVAPNLCTAGGAEVAQKLSKVLGVSISAQKKAAVLLCRGTKDCAKPRGNYQGIQTCAAACQAINGTKLCAFGCAGFGDCAAACEFGGIVIGEDGLPHIELDNCTGCGACVRACPKKLISLYPADTKGPIALCQNRSDNKPSILKNCKNACIKCGKCEKVCEAGALVLKNGIPEIDYQKCTACAKCVQGCPTHVLSMNAFSA